MFRSTVAAPGFSSTLLPDQSSEWCSTDSGDARRSFDCLIYQNVVFEPWASGQFGTDLSQLLPQDIQREVGHFNVFDLADFWEASALRPGRR